MPTFEDKVFEEEVEKEIAKIATDIERGLKVILSPENTIPGFYWATRKQYEHFVANGVCVDNIKIYNDLEE